MDCGKVLQQFLCVSRAQLLLAIMMIWICKWWIPVSLSLEIWHRIHSSQSNVNCQQVDFLLMIQRHIEEMLWKVWELAFNWQWGKMLFLIQNSPFTSQSCFRTLFLGYNDHDLVSKCHPEKTFIPPEWNVTFSCLSLSTFIVSAYENSRPFLFLLLGTGAQWRKGQSSLQIDFSTWLEQLFFPTA